MLRRSLSTDTLRPSIREELLAPTLLPSQIYSNHVRDSFYPARQAKLAHSRSYADLNAAWRSYPREPLGSLTLNYLAEPGWRDRLDHTLKSADRVMDTVHKSLFPTKHYINVGEWAYFDWDAGKVVQPMFKPWNRAYSPQGYSRCWSMRNWTNEYGRTFNHYANDRWRRFAGSRQLSGSWTWPPYWMHGLSQEGVFTSYYKNPLYYTPNHQYYDYLYH